VTDPARQHEEEIGEPVQIAERTVADVLDAHETEHVALGPPAHGAGDVQERAGTSAARQDERLERREPLLAAVHALLEGRHLGVADLEHPRDPRGRRRRQLGAEVEELALEDAQDAIELAARGVPADVDLVRRAHDAERGVELVDRAVRVDAR
jgi:hypothetical protein